MLKRRYRKTLFIMTYLSPHPIVPLLLVKDIDNTNNQVSNMFICIEAHFV
jgi:hypothetical protein